MGALPLGASDGSWKPLWVGDESDMAGEGEREVEKMERGRASGAERETGKTGEKVWRMRVALYSARAGDDRWAIQWIDEKWQ